MLLMQSVFHVFCVLSSYEELAILVLMRLNYIASIRYSGYLAYGDGYFPNWTTLLWMGRGTCRSKHLLTRAILLLISPGCHSRNWSLSPAKYTYSLILPKPTGSFRPLQNNYIYSICLYILLPNTKSAWTNRTNLTIWGNKFSWYEILRTPWDCIFYDDDMEHILFIILLFFVFSVYHFPGNTC